MKNPKYKKIYIVIIALVFVFSAVPVLAAVQEYIPLEKDAFAGMGIPSSTGGGLVSLLTNVFNFGIAAAVVLALVMIIWGGIIKMTTDSWQGQDEAKSKFENAGYGLGLALLSYLILYTINPCLVYFGDKSACNNQLLFAPPPAVIDETTGKPDECSHCVTIPSDSNVKCKPGVGCRLNVDLLMKLDTALKGQDTYVTEGYPSTIPHQSPCHDDGTCADVALTNPTIPNIMILNTNLTNAGLKPWYELSNIDPTGENKKTCDMWNSANPKVNCRLVTVTGPHFHVEQ